MEIIDDQPVFEKKYFNKPRLILRVKSTIIDGFILIPFMFFASIIFTHFGIESVRIKIVTLLVILSYEPILTSLNRTLGQKAMGIRVRNYNKLKGVGERKNINIIFSLFRFLAKVLLGWISLLTIHSDKHGRAIHDMIGGSVMTIEK